MVNQMIYSTVISYKRFTLNQRIRELQKAIDRWPDSEQIDTRRVELQEHLKELADMSDHTQ